MKDNTRLSSTSLSFKKLDMELMVYSKKKPVQNKNKQNNHKFKTSIWCLQKQTFRRAIFLAKRLETGFLCETYSAYTVNTFQPLADPNLCVKILINDHSENIRNFVTECKYTKLMYPSTKTLVILDAQTSHVFYGFAMPFLKGQELLGVMNNIFFEGHYLSIRQSINFSLGILCELYKLHFHQIEHFDLKPENIIYDATKEQVRLIDFGYSANFNQPPSGGGTLTYMSPEQAVKFISKDMLNMHLVQHFLNQVFPTRGKSDVYSFGLILTMLLGNDYCFRRRFELQRLRQQTPQCFNRILKNTANLLIGTPNITAEQQNDSRYILVSAGKNIQDYHIRAQGQLATLYLTAVHQILKKILCYNPKQRPSVKDLLFFFFKLIDQLQSHLKLNENFLWESISSNKIIIDVKKQLEIEKITAGPVNTMSFFHANETDLPLPKLYLTHAFTQGV